MNSEKHIRPSILWASRGVVVLGCGFGTTVAKFGGTTLPSWTFFIGAGIGVVAASRMRGKPRPPRAIAASCEASERRR